MLLKFLTVLIFLLLLFMAAAAIALLFPIHKFNPAAAEGENILKSDTPQFALARFNRAETELPVLKYNFYFNGQKNKAMIEIQKYKVKNPALIIFINEDYDAGLLVDFVSKLKSQNEVIEARFVPAEESSKSYLELTKKRGMSLVTGNDTSASSTIEVYLAEWTFSSKIEEIARSEEFVTEVIVFQIPS